MNQWMAVSLFNQVSHFLEPHFSPESLKATLSLALLSTLALVGLFAYLNRYTRRQYFSLWTVAWLFYILWLTLKISSLGMNGLSQWRWLESASIGITAIYLFLGALHFGGKHRDRKEVALMIFFTVAWSYAAQTAQDRYYKTLWFSLPLFLVLSAASFLAA